MVHAVIVILFLIPFIQNVFLVDPSWIPRTNSYQGLFTWIKSEKKYDNRFRPYYEEGPVNISVDLEVISISDMSEHTMTWSAELYFRQYWTDPRLKFNSSNFANNDVVEVDLETQDILWTPDSYFLNAISCRYPTRNSPTHRYRMRLWSNGSVYSNRRISVTFTCYMKLMMYPFDQQACRMELCSYGMTTSNALYTWHQKRNETNLLVPDFQVSEVVQADPQIRQYTGENFSVLELCMKFQRKSGFAYLQLFIPSTAVVASSWIALWIEEDSQFADIVTVILAITFLSYSYNQMMPKVSYVKAMDIYLGACFVFVFISLVKLALVKYTLRRKINMERSQLPVIAGATSITEGLGHSVLEESPIPVQKSFTKRRTTSVVAVLQRLLGQRTDRVLKCMHVFHVWTQILLPICFVGFALFFFFIYPSVYTLHDIQTC